MSTATTFRIVDRRCRQQQLQKLTKGINNNNILKSWQEANINNIPEESCFQCNNNTNDRSWQKVSTLTQTTWVNRSTMCQQQYHLEELTESVRFNNIKDISEESCFNCNNINSEQEEEENLDENWDWRWRNRLWRKLSHSCYKPLIMPPGAGGGQGNFDYAIRCRWRSESTCTKMKHFSLTN